MAPNWSTLPLDLLTAVAFNLESFEDFIYFSLVCRSWNRASSSIKHIWRAKPEVPWLLLVENTKDNPDCVRKMLNIDNENKCYRWNLPETFGGRCWGSPYGWVAMAKLDLSVQLFNPITKATISFPSLETLPYLPKNTPAYNNERRDYYHSCLSGFLTKLIVLKVSQNDHRHEFVIMIIYDFHRRLAFARHGDPSWTSVLIKETTSVRIFDVVAMDNHVYAIYDDAAIAYWEIKEFFGFELVKPMDYLPGDPETFNDLYIDQIKVYLIQSNTDLLMVLRSKVHVSNADNTNYDYDIVYRTNDFEIFKLNHIDKDWENVEDLGDVALFVGDNSSMSVSVADDAKCLQPSCIYFTDDESGSWLTPREFGGHDMGVFDFKTNDILRFYEGDDTRSFFCTPTWFIPQF
ncbi:putative F-box protein At5g55150 [Silene latifolia]|uniref:putative F-box protein At5g55150 n=1 Tax=Silene latifolia TaxID=37657 RepID=UPI003D7884B0